MIVLLLATTTTQHGVELAMQPYASRTGTRDAVILFKEWRWRLMVSAKGVHSSEGMPYALDNGAWTSFKRGEPFDSTSFLTALAWSGGKEDFVVVPDVVGDRKGTVDMGRDWVPRLKSSRLYLAVQDGMSIREVVSFLPDIHGIFVGGSDHFKESEAGFWCAVARDHGLRSHVGRVNTKRRIAICQEAGADSFDGSGASQFIKHAECVQRWLCELGVRW